MVFGQIHLSVNSFKPIKLTVHDVPHNVMKEQRVASEVQSSKVIEQTESIENSSPWTEE